MRKKFLRMGSIMALIAVVLGAFGAHILESYLTPEEIETFNTGVRYHFYHSFALLLCGVLLHYGKKSNINYAGWFFFGGILLFSGSLYFLSMQETLDLNLFWLGPVTPLGGLSFMIGWVLLFLSTYQTSERKKKPE